MVLLLPVLFLLVACGAEDPALLSVPVTFRAAGDEVTPAEGVVLLLNEATLSLSDLRLEAPAETAISWSLIPAAHAHPGHDFAGDVAGELTGTWTLNLIGEDLRLGEAACYEGDYATGRLTVLPEPVARLAGTATLGGTTLPFLFELAPDQEITGLSFGAEMSADEPPGGIGLGVDLAHIFSFVDWQEGDTDGDGTLTVSDGTFGNTLLFGLVATPTWTIRLEQP